MEPAGYIKLIYKKIYMTKVLQNNKINSYFAAPYLYLCQKLDLIIVITEEHPVEVDSPELTLPEKPEQGCCS